EALYEPELRVASPVEAGDVLRVNGLRGAFTAGAELRGGIQRRKTPVLTSEQIPLGIRIPHHAIEVTHAQGVAVALRGVRADSGAQEVRLEVAFGTQRARLRALREQRDAALAGALAELRNVSVGLVGVRDRA